jgi:hypothetical protein
MSEDITTQDTQDTQDTAPIIATFGIFKDGEVPGMGRQRYAMANALAPGRADGMTFVAPLWRAFVDVPSDDYGFDPENYGTPYKVLERWFEINQPDDIAGVWWVGKVPDPDASSYGYGSGWHLMRFKVERTISING